MADTLSKLATIDVNSFGRSVYLEVLGEPSTLKKVVMAVERSNCWLTLYLEYLNLNEGRLPSNRMLAKKVKHRSS